MTHPDWTKPMTLADVPAAWRPVVADVVQTPEFAAMARSLVSLAKDGIDIVPPRHECFAALALTPPDAVRAVILGQDPYPTPGHAHGLAFSVSESVRPLPRSLSNIFKELHEDLAITPPQHGSLKRWAEQGVLLLNAALTLQSDKGKPRATPGWSPFVAAILNHLGQRAKPPVFILWGKPAQKLADGIERDMTLEVRSNHPSPLSANRGGFFDTKPFSRVNAKLVARGDAPIDWRLS